MAGKSSQAIAHYGWNDAIPAPIVLVTGAEAFLADRAMQRLRETLKSADPSLEVSDLDASVYVWGSCSRLPAHLFLVNLD
jgi:DNA polymerase-3 subunit delta